MSKSKILAIAAVLVSAAVALFFCLDFEEGAEVPSSESKESSIARKSLRTSDRKTRKRIDRKSEKARKSASIKTRQRGSQGKVQNDTKISDVSHVEEETLTVEEKKLYDDIQEALDSENRKSIIELCKRVNKSSKRELRAQAVNALGWFDVATMPELTAFLDDPDEDIASDALFQWQEALTQIESDKDRVRIVMRAMDALTDENALEQISMELNSVDEKLAIEALKQIINSSNPACADKGKEAYEFITGEKYTNPAAADKWLKENYTPPEE